jgi:hypothetical protein
MNLKMNCLKLLENNVLGDSFGFKFICTLDQRFSNSIWRIKADPRRPKYDPQMF